MAAPFFLPLKGITIMKYTGQLLTSNEKLAKTEYYLLKEKKQKWIMEIYQWGCFLGAFK